MTSRIRVFDHFQKPIQGADFSNIPSTPREWILNGYGRCDLSVGFDPLQPQAGQAWQERIWQYGNLVHIEHIPDKDGDGNNKGQLPDWVGIILPERNWDFGVGHVTAYSAESVLVFRAMPYLSVKGTPKTVFSQILKYAHETAKNIIIQPGQLDDQALTFSDNLRTNAYDHIVKLCKDAQMDFSVTGYVNEKGNLELYANLYNRKGIDTGLTLHNNNSEMSGRMLSEQGTLSNQVFGHSQAQTARGRFEQEVSDQASIDDYGPLQLNQVYLGRQDPASVQNATQARVDKRSRPIKFLTRNALDWRNTFDYLDAGNTVTVKDTTVGFHPNGGYGFEAQFRIKTLSYNDLSNKAPLTLEFVQDIDYIPLSASVPVLQDNMLWDDADTMLWDDNDTILWDA